VKRAILLLLHAVLLGAPLAAAAHPDSRSSSRLAVDGARGRIALSLRCQARSLAEALRREVDLDGDGRLDARELETGRDALERYVGTHYAVFAGACEPRAEAAPIAARLRAVTWIAPESAASGEPWVELELDLAAGAPLEGLAVRDRLFREENPFHRDEAQIVWDGSEPVRRSLDVESGELWLFRPDSARRGGLLLDYLREGLVHILTGYDHLAFLAALLLSARGLRSVAGTITAFTVAHSVTLALAAFDLVRAPASLVEPAIALSIAWIAAQNLFARTPRSRWGEAFAFGLVHGLGFAGAIGDALAYEPRKLFALGGFNLGVETGQLALVLPAALVCASWPRAAAPGDSAARAWLAPAWLRRGGSAVVLALGLYWLVGRLAGG
jgi:hydrogenase/urease accessory protein HupE